MTKVVVADTTCLILLSGIDALFVLQKLFSEIIITPEVASEFGENTPTWITTQQTANLSLHKELQLTLDEGESSAICLAKEINALLIIDEKKGRKKAKELNIEIIGTLGLLLIAKQKRIIKNVKPLLDKLKTTGIWIHPTIINYILTEAKET